MPLQDSILERDNALLQLGKSQTNTDAKYFLYVFAFYGYHHQLTPGLNGNSCHFRFETLIISCFSLWVCTRTFNPVLNVYFTGYHSNVILKMGVGLLTKQLEAL